MLNRRTLILVAITVVLIGLIFFSNRPDPEENQANDGAAVQIDRVLQEGQPGYYFALVPARPVLS